MRTPFTTTGGVALYRKRAKYAAAMTADGFRPHEIRKVLHLLDRGGPVVMEAYCREVVERRSTVTQRDWSKIDPYAAMVD